MSKNIDLSLFKEDLKSCTEHIKKTKALKNSLVVIFVYLVFTILCFLLVPLFIPIENTVIANDFRIFYQSAQTILVDPEQLYVLPDYNMPFRYLPLFSLLFVPYTFVPFGFAFIIHTFILGAVQTVSFYLIYIISTRFYNIKYNKKVKSDLLYICLMAPLQVPMILFGQISHFFIILILIVILLLENDRTKRYEIKYSHFFIGLILGLAISLKPFSILLVPLLIRLVIVVDNRKIKIHLKKLAIIVSGLVISQSINIVYLIFYPHLFQDFLDINFNTQLFDYPSTSITRFISFFFNLFSIEAVLMIILTFILYGLLYSTYLITPTEKINYPAYISMVILIVMINFTDSWFLNFFIWVMLFFPGLFWLENEFDIISSEKLKKRLKITNFIVYKIIHYGVVYFTAGLVLGLTIFPTDPIMPFVLIFLYIILLWRLFRIH
ncbi:MAG: glycosyltransferase 87 family protein [Candidatus Thorarchaeota archaeon]